MFLMKILMNLYSNSHDFIPSKSYNSDDLYLVAEREFQNPPPVEIVPLNVEWNVINTRAKIRVIRKPAWYNDFFMNCSQTPLGVNCHSSNYVTTLSTYLPLK